MGIGTLQEPVGAALSPVVRILLLSGLLRLLLRGLFFGLILELLLLVAGVEFFLLGRAVARAVVPASEESRHLDYRSVG